MNIEKTVYQKWQDKEITDMAALEAMCRTLVGIGDSLEPLKESEKQARDQISLIVEKIGGNVTVRDFGTLRITEPTLLENYNREKLDRLVASLEADGQLKQAEQIKACRQQSSRIGSLRIDRLRPQPQR